MTPAGTAFVVFVCVFGGALFGVFVRGRVPDHHLSDDSREVIKLGMGLIATIAALVLGLLIATAKGSFDTQDTAIKHTAAKIILLDNLLANYGPETGRIRGQMRDTLARKICQVWPEERSLLPKAEPIATMAPPSTSATIGGDILKLTPRNEAQRWFQVRALQVADEITETRLFITGGMGSSIPAPFLIVMILWLTFIFGCLGIFSPRNTTVMVVLFICALSAAGAVFLIMEMDQPFGGLMKISSGPLHYTLSHLDR